MTKLKDKNKSHYYWLDFLKFISMIIVFLCHLRMAFFYDKFGTIHIGRFALPNYIFRGNLAVCMFLLISVYLYVKKALEEKYGNVVDFWKLCIKRYIRLFVPAVVCNFLIFISIVFHLFFNVGAYNIEVPYVNDWFNFSSLTKAFCSMLWADANTCLFENGYNPPLWCYNLLFISPLLAFAVVRLLGNKKAVIISFMILPLLLLHKSYFVVIPLAIISQMQADSKSMYYKFLWGGVMVFCIIFQMLDATYQIPLINKFSVSINMLLVTSIFNLFQSFSVKERNIFTLKIFYHLNKIGFSMYLLHMPVICSVGFYLFRSKYTFFVIFTVIVLVLLHTSILFHIFVERKLTSKIISKLNI